MKPNKYYFMDFAGVLFIVIIVSTIILAYWDFSTQSHNATDPGPDTAVREPDYFGMYVYPHSWDWSDGGKMMGFKESQLSVREENALFERKIRRELLEARKDEWLYYKNYQPDYSGWHHNKSDTIRTKIYYGEPQEPPSGGIENCGKIDLSDITWVTTKVEIGSRVHIFVHSDDIKIDSLGISTNIKQ